MKCLIVIPYYDSLWVIILSSNDEAQPIGIEATGVIYENYRQLLSRFQVYQISQLLNDENIKSRAE